MTKNTLGASQRAIQVGNPSLAWVHRQIGQTNAQNLHNWHREKNQLFEAIILGTAQQFKKGIKK